MRAVRLVLALLRWHELAQQRRRLLSLDDRMLKDIGITRAEAMREGMRPFWDASGIGRHAQLALGMRRFRTGVRRDGT